MLELRKLAAASMLSIVWAQTAAAQPSSDSPFLLVFAGDEDEAQSDFFAVIDMRAGSPTRGEPIATLPIGMRASMPHHMEYFTPPAGERIFANAHHHEMSLLIDVSNPLAPTIAKRFGPPAPLRFPHDFTRTPTGTRLVGFLRSEGASPDPQEVVSPGNHGGIAEYTADGELLRLASAEAPGVTTPIRPYAFAFLPHIDRLVVTSAAMMEHRNADVVQVFRYSDFALLETMQLPPGRLADGTEVPGSQRQGFGPRVLDDGSVFFNAYGCAFYRLDNLAEQPRLTNVFTLQTPNLAPDAPAHYVRGSCGIPVVFGDYWLMPVGQLHAVVVLDIADPSAPREVSRLSTPDSFNPHWLHRDQSSNRLVLGAELGGESGYFVLRFDDRTGRLSFDPEFRADGQRGYLTLHREAWPHGTTGPAWGHAALFLRE
jgi:hypothetical protein